MTPSWYDVLDVEPTATDAEIRTAWKAAIADLDPSDRRFKRCSAAAEVLLDPDKRAAHDAALAADAAEAESEEDSAERLEPVVVASAPTKSEPTQDAVPTGATATRERRGRLWLLPAVLGVVAVVLVAATVVALVRGSAGRPLPDGTQVAAAQSAAEAAVVPLLSFDYRRLDDDKAAAEQFLTPSYREEYDRYFAGVVQDNAPRVQAVVSVQLLSSGIVRTGPGQVDVLTFFNRPTRNAEVVKIDRNAAILRMVDRGDEWLVDCVITTPGGTCGG